MNRLVPLGLCGIALLSACAAGNGETDRRARVIADAISYPRQTSAAGFARAALATPLAAGGDLVVLEAADVEAADPGGPSARLVVRIHEDGDDAWLFGTDPVDACYEMRFGHHGVVGEPSRVRCPENAVAITPPPVPRTEVPQSHDEALPRILAELPAEPTEADVDAALATLPAPPVDPRTGLAGVPPEVDSTVEGLDVGVAVRARSGDRVHCLMGVRRNGEVVTWRPSYKRVAPGELTCDGMTALHFPR